MASSRERLAALGAAIPDIILPADGTDLEAWAVVACDQFTQDAEYWDRVERRVAESPSMLRLILPEIFLEDDRAGRIANIRAAMDAYRSSGVFAPPIRGGMYIERATPYHGLRRGLVLAVDLERYEWAPSARPLIRATEGTVPERIPPRMEIRRGAPIESPHVLLLIDDDERSLIEGLGAAARSRSAAYRSPLMLGAGSISGWTLDREEDWDLIADGLERLAARATSRYGDAGETPFLFAVGDGNHSLATAKAVWDEHKAARAGDPAIMAHPARWALVEIENLYDDGIEFEPIHRIVFSATSKDLVSALSSLPAFSATAVSGAASLSRLVAERSGDRTRYGVIAPDACVLIETAAQGVATEPLQPILDAFVAADSGRSIDYLHGAEETVRLALRRDPPAVALLLPPVDKSDLFATVARSGPLPRKSFSMGEAIEKRFYLECRPLFG